VMGVWFETGMGVFVRRGALFRAWVYMVWVRRSDCSAPAR
jgi:hypothetical protein